MSETNKVVVTLKIGVDVDAFIDEMSTHGNVSPHVPNRVVDIFNLKEDSLRNVDFTMTHAEMKELEKDPRVLACRWGTKADNGLFLKYGGIDNTTRHFTRTAYYDSITANDDCNWGLFASSTKTNPFVGNYSTGSVNSSSMPMILDGTNVDVVIFDSGIQADHPEFTDEYGVSRVKQIDWFAASGGTISGTMPSDFYTDPNGHGTNVASIAVGKTYGWAKNANIYSMRLDKVSTGQGFNLIRQWHIHKAVNQKTGRKNPTIVNCSFGYRRTLVTNLDGNGILGAPIALQWRNTQRFLTIEELANLKSLQKYGLFPNWDSKFDIVNMPGKLEADFATIPGYDESINADAADCINAGIILVGAAGNQSYKIDVPGGIDYDNSIAFVQLDRSISAVFYNRGSSPTSLTTASIKDEYDKIIDEGFICVGAIDYTVGGSSGRQNSNPPNPFRSYSTVNADAKAYFSETGPRVDVYAPGGLIAGAYTSMIPNGGPQIGPVSYYKDVRYKSAKISGTSQASPQVTGVLACVLQANPHFTQSDAKRWLVDNSVNKVVDIGPNEYTNLYSLQGGSPRYLYFYHGISNVGSVSGSGIFSGGVKF
jgi:hypothetical protein